MWIFNKYHDKYGGENMKSTKLSTRVWISLIVFGLFGQLAWTVENMYFNVYVYNTITGNTTVIASMVAFSALTATLTTLFMGALSDKAGKRKVFICAGYIIWGFTTFAFSLVTVHNVSLLFPAANAVVVAGILVVIMDCVMTFFGSTANDAAFNAWVTDVTVPENRGKTETVLSIMPLLAMAVVFGALAPLTMDGKWTLFFAIVGGLTSLGGVIGLFVIKDQPGLKAATGNYGSNLIYGFRPSTVKANQRLYITFCTIGILSMAQQVFMPYLIIYIEKYLGFTNYIPVVAVAGVIAMALSLGFGRLMDKIGKAAFLIPSWILLLIGFIAVYLIGNRGNQIVFGILGGVMLGAGFLLTSAVSGLIRDFTPESKAGQFQGVRIFFVVLLPMVTGPYIGSGVIKNTGMTYEELGQIKPVPTPEIFLASAVVAVFAIVPILFLLRAAKKKN